MPGLAWSRRFPGNQHQRATEKQSGRKHVIGNLVVGLALVHVGLTLERQPGLQPDLGPGPQMDQGVAAKSVGGGRFNNKSGAPQDVAQLVVGKQVNVVVVPQPGGTSFIGRCARGKKPVQKYCHRAARPRMFGVVISSLPPGASTRAHCARR